MSECIKWHGSYFPSGYGQKWFRRRNQLAHRVAWTTERGEIPEGMNVLHKCDNRWCVNTNHLFLGSLSDNAKDREAKGRGRDSRGSKNGSHKITEQTAVRIKKLSGVISGRSIAMALGISVQEVCNIMNKNRWRHVTANTRYSF